MIINHQKRLFKRRTKRSKVYLSPGDESTMRLLEKCPKCNEYISKIGFENLRWFHVDAMVYGHWNHVEVADKRIRN